jgi:hypothetical protein
MAVVSGGGGDSADPRKILQDLQQLAAVCQRLGIDLAKVSAMGQTVSSGGKGPGNIGDQHSSQMPGGGTGYQNLGQGRIIGSTVSANMALKNAWMQMKPQTFRGLMSELDKERSTKYMPDPGRLGWISNPQYAGGLRGWSHRAHGSTRGTEEDIYLSYSDEMVGQLVGQRKTQAQRREGKRIAWAQRKSIRKMFDDKVNRRMFSYHMISGMGGDLYNALSEPIDEANGETAAYRAVNTVGSQISKAGHIASSIAWAEAAMASGRGLRVASKALWAGKLGKAAVMGVRAAKYAGPQAIVALGIDAALTVGGEVMDRWKDENEALMKAAKFRRSMKGEMHSQWTQEKNEKDNPTGYIYTTKTKPMDPKQVAKFEASVEEARNEFYVDSNGRKIRRNVFSRTIRNFDSATTGWGWLIAPAFKAWANWGVSEERDKERAARYEEAQKRHQSAMQKGQVMDWDGAKADIAKAKEALVSEELMPFFWKQPEVFLRQMEASRIAGRNWARAQQPRGASRTGD